MDSLRRIEAKFAEILSHGCKPLAIGGDHTISLPILRAIRKQHGPVGMVHVDAHADVNDTMFGEKIAHGTQFRRAVEEGLLDGRRVVQIGVRGTGYAAEDFDWPRAQGFRVVQAEECWHKSLTPLMAEVREQLGRRPGLSQLRHRRARRLRGARHRRAGARRVELDPGAGDHPRLPRPRHHRRRSRRGLAALRSLRQHRPRRRRTCSSRCSACCRGCGIGEGSRTPPVEVRARGSSQSQG